MTKRFYSHTQAVDYFGAGRKWFDREISKFIGTRDRPPLRPKRPPPPPGFFARFR